jgi:hypothetical protein
VSVAESVATFGFRSTIAGWAATSVYPECAVQPDTECIANSIIQKRWDLTGFARLDHVLGFTLHRSP